MKAFAPLFVLMPLSFCSAQFGLSPDLRAFYPMNGDAFNAQGDFENHALYVNATYGSDAQSVANNAGAFNGSARWNINRGIVRDHISDFTVEFWFKSSASSSQVLYWEGLLNQQAVWIRMEPANNRIQASIGTSSQYLQAPSVGAFNDGAWHHYALTAAANTTATVYVDGAQNATFTGSWTSATTTNFTRFGCKEDLTQYFNGSLDDLRVWDHALSTTEVLNNYSAPRITLGAIGDATVCAGSNSTLSITLSGGAFQPGNVYYAQLSDASGSFEFPKVIGTLAGTGDGSVPIQIPTDIATSSNYRVRVLASNTPTASQNTLPITINNPDASPGYDVSSDLRIRYPFDGDAMDASGNGIDGTLAGGLLSDTGHTHLANTAMRFNGSNTAVSIGDRWPIKRLHNTTLPLTVSVWLYQFTTPGDYAYVFSLYDGFATNGLWLGTTSAGKARFRINNSQLVEAPLANNTWVLLTAVYDGSTTKLYMNDTQVGSVNAAGTIQDLVPAEIGREALQGLGRYNGRMDDFRFYGRALTAQEVRRLYHDGSLVSSNAPLCDGGTLEFDGPAFAGLNYAWNGPSGFTSDLEDPTIASFDPFTQAGQYQLTLTLNGCTGGLNVLDVQSLITTPQATSTTVCEGSPYTLTASGAAAGQQYNWYADAGGVTLLAADTSTYSGSGTNTTTFYVALLQGTVCSSALAPATVQVNPLPTVSYTETSDPFCLTDPLAPLTPATPPGGLYAGAGVIGNTFDPGTAGIGTHEIVYTFSDVNGCFASDTSIVVVDICTGISDPHATDILVFPNPGNGIFGITGMRSGVHMRVLDALGREVMRMMATSTPMELDGRDWPSGVYSLWLEGDDRRVLRVVKQ